MYLYMYIQIFLDIPAEKNKKSNDGSDPFSVSVEEQYLAAKTADHL